MKKIKKIMSVLVIAVMIAPVSISAMYCADQPNWICEWAWEWLGKWGVRMMKMNLEVENTAVINVKWNVEMINENKEVIENTWDGDKALKKSEWFFAKIFSFLLFWK